MTNTIPSGEARTGVSLSGSAAWRIWHDFAFHARKTPDAPAIRVEGRSLSYGALMDKVVAFASAIERQAGEDGSSVTAVYADRSLESYAGVLAASMMGHAYVPLNPKFPPDRNRTIVELSGAALIICSPQAVAEVASIIATTPGVSLVSETPTQNEQLPEPCKDDARAYILFTSGSTGQPKGVPITHANVDAYLTAACQAVEFRSDDRFSQNFDLTFDLSVHDMFLCWRAGGELIVPSEADLNNPGEYVLREAVTCWFSVPSLAQKMSLQGALEPGALSGLRLSLFCGEALPLDLAVKWQVATGTMVENWYGPTEATIACTRYVLPEVGTPVEAHLNLTPIGECLSGMSSLVLDGDFRPVADGDVGELFVSGPQVASGYLNDPEKTAASFVTVPGRGDIYYRTGDRVKTGPDGTLQFIDRLDTQIKIRGYRVEIGEIEAVLRGLANDCTVVVTPLPLKSPSPTALIATIEGWSGDTEALLEQATAALPAYMVPTAARILATFPKNASGKVDRGRIGQDIADEAQSAAKPDKGTNVRRQLINMAIQINPGLTPKHILSASDLMEAGLDSIAFIELTMQIEKTFGIELDQNLVAEMAEMGIKRLARFIRIRRDGGEGEHSKGNGNKPNKAQAQNSAKGKRRRNTIHYNSNRTIEFVDKFPTFVENAPHPLALFIGSSGVFTGVDTKVIEARAAELGHNISAVNLGMQRLSNLGIYELIQYVKEVIETSGKEVAVAVYELEVMQLSISPVGGVREIVTSYLNGDFSAGNPESDDMRIKWALETGGMYGPSSMDAKILDSKDITTASWSKKREIEVVQAYLGDMNFVYPEVDIWIAGAKELSELCPSAKAFIHPIEDIGSRGSESSANHNKLNEMLEYISCRNSIPIMNYAEFELEYADFLNYNHTNRSVGRAKLSCQLIEAALNTDHPVTGHS